MALQFEVISGLSEGRNGTFEGSEVTIGRGPEVDLRLSSKDVAVGRGAHCRVFPDPESVAMPRVRIRNEHRNRLSVRNAELAVVLDEGDQVEALTPTVIEFGGGGPIVEIRSDGDPLPSETQSLLDRSRLGDESARKVLLEEHLSWVQAMVRKEMGQHLRDKVESVDMVQEVAIGFLGEKNRHYFNTGEDLRNYLVNVIRHKITDEARRQGAGKRDKQKERAMDAGSRVGYDPADPDQERPSQAFGRKERDERLAALLEGMDPDVRALLIAHEIEGRTFVDIGEELGLSEDAVRMKYKRALAKLREEHGDAFEV